MPWNPQQEYERGLRAVYVDADALARALVLCCR
jgi:hypothetical protein